MKDSQLAWIVIFTAVALVVAILVAFGRGSSKLIERMTGLAASLGWDELRSSWWTGGVRGRWRGFAVELRHMNRYKGTPERMLLTVRAVSPARMIVKRRIEGFFSNKPLAWFGPPFVEPMNFAMRDQYWIRSDQRMFVETMFSRGNLAAALEPNLVARFDVVDLRSNRLTILRAIDDRAVRKKYDRPSIQWGRDYDLNATIAAEEWKLASELVEVAGLRPLA